MIGARLSAAVWGIGQFGFAALYIAPEQLVRRPLQPGQVSTVVWIENYFPPAWSIGFALTGLLLIVAALTKKGFVRGHIASAGMWALYGGAILYSALLTEPPVPITLGTLASIVAINHIAIARGDAERGHR